MLLDMHGLLHELQFLLASILSARLPSNLFRPAYALSCSLHSILQAINSSLLLQKGMEGILITHVIEAGCCFGVLRQKDVLMKIDGVQVGILEFSF